VQINISTRHGHVSTATREKIAEKLKKLTRIYDRLTVAEVTINLENPDNLEVEIRVSAEHAEDFLATVDSGALLGLVDSAVHKLETQLRKHKEKFKTRRASGRRHAEEAERPEPETP